MKNISFFLAFILLSCFVSKRPHTCVLYGPDFVTFEQGQDNFEECNEEFLNGLFKLLNQNSELGINITGFCGIKEDSTLAIKRAENVRDFFVGKKIAWDRCRIHNGGNTPAPIGSSEMENCVSKDSARLENRVVTFSVF